MKKILKMTIVTSFLSILSLSAFGANYGFLSNTAMSYFTKSDWQIFNKTQQNVLNHGRDGVRVNWNNPKSGSHGYMVPANTTRQNGIVCRYVTFYNTANLINGEASYKFCKTNNKWMIY